MEDTLMPRVGRPILRGLVDLRPLSRATPAAPAAIARGATARAAAKVLSFATADFPGAALSQVLDMDGTTAVGGFRFDPNSPGSRANAFTFAGGVYQILSVPGSNESIATGINSSGLIVGVSIDLAGVSRGFSANGGTFSAIEFPSRHSYPGHWRQ